MCCWSTWSFWSQFFNSWPGQSVGPVLPLALLAHCITQKTGVRQELSNRHLSKLISCLAFDPSFWLFGFFSEVDNFMQRRTSAEKKILNLVCMFLYVLKRYMHPNGISKSTLVKLRRNTLQEFTSFPANVVFSVPSPFLKKNFHLVLVMICESLVPRANPQFLSWWIGVAPPKRVKLLRID